MRSISDIIRSEVDAWKDAMVSPSVSDARDINNGHCRAFAQDIKRMCGGDVTIHKYGYDDEGYTSFAHIWIEYQGRHFDAECPDGVPHPYELPLFRRGEIDPTTD